MTIRPTLAIGGDPARIHQTFMSSLAKPGGQHKLAWCCCRLTGLRSMLLLVQCVLCCNAITAHSATLWFTNGPCVFEGLLEFRTNVVPAGRVYCPPSTNLPLEIRRALIYFMVVQQTALKVETTTNANFSHFLPESLNHLAWTNVLAITNGRSMSIWSTRSRPAGWPEVPPEVTWNPASLVWGMKGFTALSPCWEGEGSPGQVPITAFTRRHGYTRGHDMGPVGFNTRLAGKKVWFLAQNNRIIERRIVREIVRTVPTDLRDYTIVLFNRDLPDSIEPMRVASPVEVTANGPSRFSFCVGAPIPLLKTEQTGAVSADIPGFTINTRKGGDSGCPNMLPLPGELVFVSGRSTSAASAAMQSDMDELCRLQGLDPRRYQLQWVDLSRFPVY